MDIYIDMILLPAWISAGIAACLAIATVLLLDAPLLRVARHKIGSTIPEEAGNDDGKEQKSTEPFLSVVAFSYDPENELDDFLSAMKSQRYRNFEVIILMETSSENCEIFQERCRREYDNVYVTFIPPGSHNLSRRKLALTVGIKAARGEAVLTTLANVEVPSEDWLGMMVEPLVGNADVEMVLGYSHMDYAMMRGGGKWYREFSSLMTDAQWLGYALKGKPYRGDGYNLLFRRELFFEHKGYSKSIYIHSGDDDLFVNEVADGANTRVALNRAAAPKIRWGTSSKRIWGERKEQYDFTSRWLPRAPFLRAGAASAMQWGVLLAALAAMVPMALNLIGGQTLHLSLLWPALSAFATLGLFWLAEICVYRKAAEATGATRLWWALPWFRLAKPILNMLFRVNHRRSRRKNYTWQR